MLFNLFHSWTSIPPARSAAFTMAFLRVWLFTIAIWFAFRIHRWWPRRNSQCGMAVLDETRFTAWNGIDCSWIHLELNPLSFVAFKIPFFGSHLESRRKVIVFGARIIVFRFLPFETLFEYKPLIQQHVVILNVLFWFGCGYVGPLIDWEAIAFFIQRFLS